MHRQSGGADGFVSLEVSPQLANQSEATIKEAQRLWEAVQRPNAMIKIPGTEAGLEAIARSIASGINVNVTLLFAVERYCQVIEAFLKGLERRLEQGLPIGFVASVASFFVSRVDGKVDALLDQRGNHSLRGKIAIANASMAYSTFQQSLATHAGPVWPKQEPVPSGHSGPPPAPRTQSTLTCTTSRR